jgi:vacuolar protein sorting-associated protein 35
LTLLKLPSGKLSPSDNSVSKSDKLGGQYTELLFLLGYGIRRTVAHQAMKVMLHSATEAKFTISTVEGVEFVFGELCSIVVHDQVDGNLFGSYASRKSLENDLKVENEGPFDWEEAVEEQTMVAKVTHLIKAPHQSLNDQFEVPLINIAAHKSSGIFKRQRGN